MFKPRKIESAEVTPAFIDKVSSMAREKINEQKYGTPLHNVAFYTDLARGVNKPGRGIDLLLTSLKRLPYAKFDLLVRNGREYLVGKTKPLVGDLAVCRVDAEKKRIPFIEVPGGYLFALPASIFFGGAKNGIHLLPCGFLEVEQRHFHHYALGNAHPLDRAGAWCWDEYSTITSNLTTTMNVSGYFNGMSFFARTYGDHRYTIDAAYGSHTYEKHHLSPRDPVDMPEVQQYTRKIK
jgi:hypothetical protein